MISIDLHFSKEQIQMVNKYMKKMLNTISRQGKQIITMMMSQAWWLMLIITTTQQAEIRRIAV
jgi:hypothetical protein